MSEPSQGEKLAHTLRNAAKSGCIRIVAASAFENRFGVRPKKTITLNRGEAVGLYALASKALESEGDMFIRDMTDKAAMEYVEALQKMEREEGQQ